MTLVPRSNEVLAELRERGAETRRQRSQLLSDLKTERMSLTDAVKPEHERIIGGVKVGRLVKAMPGWGAQRAHQLLAELDIYPEKNFRALGPKQRAALLLALGAWEQLELPVS